MKKLEYYCSLPYSTAKIVEEYKKIVGKDKVKAYSLDDNLNIVEGLGWIANNGSYNYHNNYDNSRDVLYFESVQKFWTQSSEKIKNLQKENVLKALEIINAEKERLEKLL